MRGASLNSWRASRRFTVPSDYLVGIVHRDTQQLVVSWPPRSVKVGGQDETSGPFIDALCARVKAKGVGVGSTTEHVLTDIRAAWQELLHELKARV